jgi:hypothetical protein
VLAKVEGSDIKMLKAFWRRIEESSFWEPHIRAAKEGNIETLEKLVSLCT